jgi:dihydroflavonol-4-reductase
LDREKSEKTFLGLSKILGNRMQKFGYKYPFPHFTVPKAAFSLVAPIFGHSRQFVKLNMGYPIYFNAQRSVNELGIEYRDIRESVCEHFQQLLDDGIVKKRA